MHNPSPLFPETASSLYFQLCKLKKRAVYVEIHSPALRPEGKLRLHEQTH